MSKLASKAKAEVIEAKRAKFLEALRAGDSMALAAKAARSTLATIQKMVADDDDFAEAVELATAVGGTKAAPEVAPPVSEPSPPDDQPAAPDDPTPTITVEPPLPPSWEERWSKIRAEAAQLGKGGTGQLLWVEQQCVKAGMHPMDPQWIWHFSEFYASQKMLDVGRFGLRAAKSDSCCRAIAAEVLLTQRRLEPGMVGVCPVMSRDMREADGRFETLVQVLSACGIADLTGTRSREDGFQRSGGGNGARVIALRDGEGHPVEFRIYPASVAGAAGFTGIAGFCDEVDLWGKEQAANPARKVFEILLSRYATQPTAKLHVMSASYYHESEHAKMVALGDTPLQRVARLGVEGARKDMEARARLAILINSSDPLLLTPSLPESTDIPCWVCNPVAPIENCYKQSRGNIRQMIYLYGGRVNPAGGRHPTVTIDEMRALGEANRRLVGNADSPRDALIKFDGLPSWDPRSRYGGSGGQTI